MFGHEPAEIDPGLHGLRRIALDETAWVDHLPGWVQGHAGLFETLATSTRWRTQERQMYERVVAVPRLIASLPEDGPGHPLLARIQQALDRHYGVSFPHVSLGYYRDGADSVAWHGDYVARELPEALVATVSVGAPRRFLLRPKTGSKTALSETGRSTNGKSLAFSLGWGDLIVMGGSCQRTWDHCIPKVAHADPRIAIMFRPTWYAPARALHERP